MPTNHGAERVPGAGPPPNKTRCPDVFPAKDDGHCARLADVDRLVQEAFEAASRTQENATDGPHGARNIKGACVMEDLHLQALADDVAAHDNDHTPHLLKLAFRVKDVDEAGNDLESWGPIIYIDCEVYLASKGCRLSWSSGDYGASTYSKARVLFEQSVEAGEVRSP